MEVIKKEIGVSDYVISLEDLEEAYFDCRKRKRKTINSLKFEVDWESKLVELWHSINQFTYQISRSICFIVTQGVKAPREVFAANFVDRIIHHLLHLRLYPIMNKHFISRRYNSRKGFGTLDCSGRLFEDIKTVSEKSPKSTWVFKCDVKSFFTSINRRILWRKLRRFIKKHYHGKDKEVIMYLAKLVALNDPTNGCIKKSPNKLWELIPDNKTLFKSGPYRGLAIGNLTSQLLANFYMNDFDHFIDGLFEYHEAFVDDNSIVTDDKEKLLKALPSIRNKLAEVKLELNQNKYYLQHYTKGIKFTGCQIKGLRRYPTNRVVTNFIRKVYGYNKLIHRKSNKATIKYLLNKFVASLNSYTGIMKHFSSYSLRRKILSNIDSKWFQYLYIGGHHAKVVMKRRYLLPYRYIRPKDFYLIYWY